MISIKLIKLTNIFHSYYNLIIKIFLTLCLKFENYYNKAKALE